MRTTLDIEEDVLQAAKEIAQQEGSTAGRVLSTLARRGLSGPAKSKASRETSRNGVPVLPSRGEIISLDKIQRLMDEEGI